MYSMMNLLSSIMFCIPACVAIANGHDTKNANAALL